MTKLTLFLAVIVMILGMSLTFMAKRISTLKEERDQSLDYIKSKDDSITYYVNAYGRQTARLKTSELTNRNMKELMETRELEWVKQFKSVKKNAKNLESASQISAVATGLFSIPLSDMAIDVGVKDSNIVTIDTLHLCPTRHFDNHYEWFRIQGTVTADSIVVTPMVPIKLESVVVWERKRKFLGIRCGKKEYYGESSSPNPYVTITENKIIRVGRKK